MSETCLDSDLNKPMYDTIGEILTLTGFLVILSYLFLVVIMVYCDYVNKEFFSFKDEY